MKSVDLRDGSRWPAIGLGTWKMGESKSTRSAEVAAIRFALELGYRVIDTAEMYGDGGAEKVRPRWLRSSEHRWAGHARPTRSITR